MAGLRSQKVLMTSIGALTLSDQQTTARRGSPIPQLRCIGKPCRTFQPTTVQCVPMGEDGSGGLEWKCESDLPSSLKFGAVEISCEGWSSPDDPYILKGSCGLEYNLIRSSTAFEEGSYYSQRSSDFPWSKLLFGGLALYILYRLLTIPFNRYPAIPRPILNLWRGFGGGGGGGGGGRPGFGGGPPPPYSSAKPSTNQPGEAWRPGFWSGLAAGAAALQAASLLRGNQQQGGYRRANNWGMRDDDDRGVGGSGMFRNGGGFGGGGSGGGGMGGAMRPSTGFGGTRNR